MLVTIAGKSRTEQTESGIVDDVVRLKPRRVQRLFDVRGRLGLRQVSDDDPWPFAARLFDLRRQRLKPYLAARDQRERVAVTREDARERNADA